VTECEICLPELHSGQVKILGEKCRYNVLAMGRRWGKTVLTLINLIDDQDFGALNGYPVAWYAATSKIFDEVWRLCLQILPREIIARTDTQKHRIELVTGGVIDFWSLDGGDTGGAGRGRKYRRVAIDEAALVRDMLNIWSRTIRPTLIDLEGDAWFASTPRGLNNDFYKLWCRGQNGNPDQMKGWKSWQMPTDTNPHLSRKELEEMKAEYAGRPLDYRQEMLAEFVEDAGQIFDLNWINELPTPKNWRPAVYEAWDLAGTKQDFKEEEKGRGCESVGGALVKDWMRRWWLYDLRRGKWNSGELCEQIIDFGWKHKARKIWLEDPVALWLEPFLLSMMRESSKHLPIERVVVGGRGDKIARAQASVVPVMANGSFYCDPTAPWYKGLRLDLAGFPNKGKDTVDMLSLGFAEAQEVAIESPAPMAANYGTRDPSKITWDELNQTNERKGKSWR